MSKVVFTSVDVDFNNGVCSVRAVIDPGQTTFGGNELRKMVASILQSVTGIGDAGGAPPAGDVQLRGNVITGSVRVP